MRRWRLETLKARLSEVVETSRHDGPQEITLRGRTVAVVISKREFDRLEGTKPKFVEFLRRSPLVGLALRIERDPSASRRVTVA